MYSSSTSFAYQQQQESSSMVLVSPHSSPSASVSGFTYPSVQNPKTQDVLQSIVKGRKSWKTLRGGEVVWPPELEAALIEGLEHYTPDDSRETRLLGRFPMRNRFISQYIFNKTGKIRTAKQVGSRLQQLRDTCGGRQLLKLLTPYRPPNRAARQSSLSLLQEEFSVGSSSVPCDSDSNSDVSTPATPTEAHATLQSLLYRGVGGLERDDEPRNIIYIDVMPNSTPLTPEAARVPPIPSPPGFNVVRPSQYPRYIGEIDPTVTLIAHSSISAKSHFTVRSRAGVVHSETTPMTAIGAVPNGNHGEMLYTTKLVPNFWAELCRSPDPTQFTIIQRVTQGPEHDTSSPLFSATYKFTLPFQSGSTAQQSASDSFPFIEPAIHNSPAMGLDDLLTLESFNELLVFDDKTMHMYNLAGACYDWKVNSPATSTSSESFSDAHDNLMSPTSTSFPEIPSIAL